MHHVARLRLIHHLSAVVTGTHSHGTTEQAHQSDHCLHRSYDR